jgi:hypothetical protein
MSFAASKQRNSNSVQGIFMYEKFNRNMYEDPKFCVKRAEDIRLSFMNHLERVRLSMWIKSLFNIFIDDVVEYMSRDIVGDVLIWGLLVWQRFNYSPWTEEQIESGRQIL